MQAGGGEAWPYTELLALASASARIPAEASVPAIRTEQRGLQAVGLPGGTHRAAII